MDEPDLDYHDEDHYSHVCDETEEHICPYKSEINDDDEDTCTCCPECEHECAQSI